MNIVIFGAGNVGRGFLGLEMYLRGYDITFVDVNKEIIDYLQKKGEYKIRFFDKDSMETVKIKEALHISQNDSIQEAVELADVVLTAVGAGNLVHLSKVIANGIQNEKDQLVIACENAPKNTEKLREYVSKLVPRLTGYAEFANCVIDRICLRDEDSVIVEPTYEWIVETRSHLLKDIEKTDNLDAYFTRKLFLVNSAHAIIGYVGAQRNTKYVHESLKNEEIRGLVEGALRESCFGLSQEFGFNLSSLESYVENLLKRFSNPAIKDEVSRLVRDPIRKLQSNERLIGPAVLALKYGLHPENLCRSVAYLLMYDGDAEGKKLQDVIATNGVTRALVEYTGLSEDSGLLRTIELEYHKLQKNRERILKDTNN